MGELNESHIAPIYRSDVGKRKDNRGGRREGSGRKKVEGYVAKVQLSIYIDPEAKRKFMTLRDKKNLDMSAMIEKRIEELARLLGVE